MIAGFVGFLVPIAMNLNHKNIIIQISVSVPTRIYFLSPRIFSWRMRHILLKGDAFYSNTVRVLVLSGRLERIHTNETTLKKHLKKNAWRMVSMAGQSDKHIIIDLFIRASSERLEDALCWEQKRPIINRNENYYYYSYESHRIFHWIVECERANKKEPPAKSLPQNMQIRRTWAGLDYFRIIDCSEMKTANQDA